MINMFKNIKQITIQKKTLEKTFTFLQHHGKHHHESHAIWAGVNYNDVFRITDVLFPKQINRAVSYEVSEYEMFKICVELSEKKIIAIAQIHTHPQCAFHSSTDDDYPSVVLPNSFSVVIPNYGYIERENIDDWEIYIKNVSTWHHITKIRARKLFLII